MLMARIMTGRAHIDIEARALQQTVTMTSQPTGDAIRQHPMDTREHPRLEIRQGIEHGADEHVAGDAAERIEMELHQIEGTVRGA